jgi:hypothetical protein
VTRPDDPTPEELELLGGLRPDPRSLAGDYRSDEGERLSAAVVAARLATLRAHRWQRIDLAPRGRTEAA